MSNTAHTDTANPSCGCDDHDLDELRALIARGYDQFDASRLLWGSNTPRSHAHTLERAGREARTFVRTALTAAFPWLRLPEELETP